MKTEVGDGGVAIRKKTRVYSWVCDVGDKGVRRQTLLSFGKTTPRDTIETPDTTQGEGGSESVRATWD